MSGAVPRANVGYDRDCALGAAL